MKYLFFLAALGFLLAQMAHLFSPPAPPVAEPPPCEDVTRAVTVAERLVKQRLKSPKTAEFAPRWEARHGYKGNCVHTVYSYVDSQNGFGALLRTHFHATVDMSGYESNGGHLVDLVTDE